MTFFDDLDKLERGARAISNAGTAVKRAADVLRARRTGRLLMAGYNYRFSPSMQHLKSVLDRGRLGVPLYAQALTFGYCLHHTLDLLCSFLGEVEQVFATFRADGPAPTAIPTQHIGDWTRAAS